MKSYGQLEQLDEKTHDRNSFDYGAAELNDFLLMFASVHQQKGIITMRKERKMTDDHIARKLNIPQRTVSRHLTQAKLFRQKDIAEPKDEDPPQRLVLGWKTF